MKITDNEVTAALLKAGYNEKSNGHEAARRIVGRTHFKVIYERNPNDLRVNPEAGRVVYGALGDKFGPMHFRHHRYNPGSGAPDFPVRMRDDTIVSSLAISETLQKLPIASTDYVFANEDVFDKSKKWLDKNKGAIIQPKTEGERHGEA